MNRHVYVCVCVWVWQCVYICRLVCGMKCVHDVHVRCVYSYACACACAYACAYACARSIKTDEAFGAKCVIGGAGWDRRPEGALKGIPRGSRSRAGRLLIRSGWLPPPAACGCDSTCEPLGTRARACASLGKTEERWGKRLCPETSVRRKLRTRGLSQAPGGRRHVLRGALLLKNS